MLIMDGDGDSLSFKITIVYMVIPFNNFIHVYIKYIFNCIYICIYPSIPVISI